MTLIDRSFLRSFNTEALAVLTALAKKHGVSVQQKAGSFARDGSNATIKFELATVTSGGVVLTKEAAAFKREAGFHGLDANSLGSIFTYMGEEYRITGYNSRRPKFPVSAVRVSDERSMKFPLNVVKGATAGVGNGF